MANIGTGVQTVFMMFYGLSCLLIARGWQSMLYNPGGLRIELYQLRLWPAYSIALVLVIIAASYGSKLALDTIPVLMMPLFLAGLSLVHYLAAPMKTRWLWLGTLYLLLILVFPQVCILLVSLAFVDSWINFRGRLGLKLKE